MISGEVHTGGWVACLLFGALISANSQNAAPLYREAFAYQERLNAEFPDEQHQSEVWKKAIYDHDFDADARRYLEVIDSHLDLAVEASALPECRWNEATSVRYVGSVSRGGSLARMLEARMRLRMLEGATDAALDDFFAIIRMSGNLEGEHRSLIGFIRVIYIQRSAIDQLAAVLPRESEAAMSRLADFWSKHRSTIRWELGDRLRSDFRFKFDEIRRQLEAGNAVEEVKKLMILEQFSPNIRGFFAAIDDKAGMLAALEKLEEYNELGAVICDNENFEAFSAARTRFAEEYQGKPIDRAWWFTSDGLESSYLRAKMHQVATAMFDLAIRRAIDGDRALDEVTDPGTGKPFVIRDAGEGYVIESEFEGFEGFEKPLQLTVGADRSATP